MGEMALGYGSEYQLLRFLGHHRQFLNKTILDALNKKNEIIEWFDYPMNNNRDSLDGELKGIECFKENNNFDFIQSEWEKFWPVEGNCQNWDGIFKIGNEWYFVEAKAQKSEVYTSCESKSEENLKIIKQAFIETIERFSSSVSADFWISKECKAYQLANRLAFLVFCEKIGIKVHLLYINFIHGFEKKDLQRDSSINSKEEWIEIWTEEYKMLGLKAENLKDVLCHVFIDCKKQ